MKFKKIFQLIKKYSKPYKKLVFFLIFLTILVAIFGATTPYLYGKLVDLVLQESPPLKNIAYIILTWFLLIIFKDWFYRISYERSVYLTEKVSQRLMFKLYDHFLKLPLSFHKEKKIGKTFRKINEGLHGLYAIFEHIVIRSLPSTLTLIISLIILFFINWLLGILMLVTVILYIFTTIKKTNLAVKEIRKSNKSWEKTWGNLYETAYNIETVKTNTRENIDLKEKKKEFNQSILKQLKVTSIFRKIIFWKQNIENLGFLIIFILGLYLLLNKIITPGELVSFIGYLTFIFVPLNELSYKYQTLKRSSVSLERAIKLLKETQENYNGQKIKKEQVKGNFEFKNVSFSYGKKKVLKNISFKVKAGQTIAFVGESGVGKTTLLSLISRFNEINKGKILLDNINIQEISLHSLRNLIAIVPQEIMLFNDTLENNLKYANSKASLSELKKIAKLANVDEFAKKLAKKYKQIVGERGVKLSTGQKQRVAIARALIRNPKILILDEATSNLDSLSEKLIQDSLEKIRKDRTTFVIAHRLSTIKKADKIIVLDKGKIVGQGTHNQLLKNNSQYRKLYKMQKLND